MSWLIVPPDPTVLPLESFTWAPTAEGSNMNHWTLPIGTVVPDPSVTAAHHLYSEYTDDAAYGPPPSSSRPRLRADLLAGTARRGGRRPRQVPQVDGVPGDGGQGVRVGPLGPVGIVHPPVRGWVPAAAVPAAAVPVAVAVAVARHEDHSISSLVTTAVLP